MRLSRGEPSKVPTHRVKTDRQTALQTLVVLACLVRLRKLSIADFCSNRTTWRKGENDVPVQKKMAA